MPENGNGTTKKVVTWFVALVVAGVVGWIGNATWDNSTAIPVLIHQIEDCQVNTESSATKIGAILDAINVLQDTLGYVRIIVNLHGVELAEIDAKLDASLDYQRKVSEQLNRILGRLNLDSFGFRPDSTQEWGMFFIPSPPRGR